MSVPKDVTAFLNGLIGRSPATRDNYDSFARTFWAFTGDKSTADITIDDVMEFLNDGLKKRGWKLSTMRQYATLCLLFFSEFKDEAFMKKLRKEIKRLPRTQSRAALYEGIYIQSDKIDPFVANAPDEEYAVLFTMILKWGLRLGEALKVAPADLDVENDRVLVRGKGIGGFGKRRLVWAEKSTITRVLQFAEVPQEQILGQKPIRDTSPIIKKVKDRMAEYVWKEVAKKTGLKHWKQLTPHDGRHSYAIDFLVKRKQEGMNALILLKNQLGHANINTTMLYLDLAGVEAKDIFNAGVQNSNKNSASIINEVVR